MLLSAGIASAGALLYYYSLPARKRKKVIRAGGGIEWIDIRVELLHKETKTVLLANLSGSARPGTIAGILGPSGAGKSTLLNVLAGKLRHTECIKASGQLKVNGEPLQAGETIASGYVMQEDVLFSHLTVRETLKNAFQLHNAHLSPSPQSTKPVDDLLQLMNLMGVQDSIVGNVRERGISGGEKKRLSIACELISKPQVLFLDEPTTGLDSFQAAMVMKALRVLANHGCTVVLSLHQPRCKIYELLDTVILLGCSGQPIYSGCRQSLPVYFRDLGHPIPGEWANIVQ
jgi:ABC-type multidrug transport system ATPase subunit